MRRPYGTKCNPQSLYYRPSNNIYNTKNQSTLIEFDLLRRLCCINILKERPIYLMTLLLDGCAKLQQLIRNRLIGSLQNVDQPVNLSVTYYTLSWYVKGIYLRPRLSLVMLCK